MTVQRFRPDLEQNRNHFGWVFMGVAAVPIALLAWREIGHRHVTVTALVMFALLGGLFAVGYRLVFKVRYLFEIDVPGRTYSLLWDGAAGGSGPLDALGPLEIERRARRVGAEGRQKTIVQYVVITAAHRTAELYCEKTAGKARRKMEALAQAWRLPSRSLGGAVRGPDELNVPLHDRMRSDSAAHVPATLQPSWGLAIEPLSLGHAIRSRRRSWGPLIGSVAGLGLVWVVSRSATSSGIVGSLSDPEDLMGHVFAGLFAVLVLVFLGMFVQGIRDAFFPGAVLVTDRGVSYRFSRMSFREIEEITSDGPVEIVGDRRSIRLGTTFCPNEANGAVAHEIQRLILEVTEANPHARAVS
jgi:hypothetical protein